MPAKIPYGVAFLSDVTVMGSVRTEIHQTNVDGENPDDAVRQLLLGWHNWDIVYAIVVQRESKGYRVFGPDEIKVLGAECKELEVK